MTKWRSTLVAMALGAAAMPSSGAAPPVDAQFLQQYCTSCHDQDRWSGGLALDLVDVHDVGADAAMWESVVRKVRTGMMPPAGEPRPAQKLLDKFSERLEKSLDAVARTNPDPGAPGLRRLTRYEYGNVIRDLLSLEVDVATLLPPDNNSDGFDTNGETLGNSPALVESYVNAASKIARRAVGDRRIPVAQVDYRPPVGWSQDRHVDGLPLGTRGGFIVNHEFPLDGEYEIVITTASGTLFGNALPQGTQLFMTLDGAPVKAQDLRKFRYRIGAGRREIGVAMVDQLRSRGTDDIYAVTRLLGAVAGVTITGPLDATGSGDTPSRKQVFTCRPATAGEEEPCARRILARLASRAYRQPVGEHDAAVDSLLAHYRTGRAEGDFEDGIEQALARALINPRFLFRFEREPAGLAAGSIFRISDLELASRLSFFLWSSLPDEELLDVASRGKLHEPRTLEAQVRRMLADPRSKALVENFASQWLHMRALGNVPTDEQGFDENLRQALRRETQMLLTSVMREDRSINDLVNADYTFLDEQLARHYGLPGIQGSYMRRVKLDERSVRRGLLGQGSILTLTSLPDRTSPVVRGKWILENLLGAHVPAPPAGVETNLEPPPGHEQPMTLRQRLEAHRVQEDCKSCHRVIDPIGFALENFDRTGRWRTEDNGLPVDSNGELTDGTPLDGPESLRAWMETHPDVFATNFANKLLVYALGRSVSHRDMPVVREIVRKSRASGHRFSQLVLGVVQSDPFRFRMVTAPVAAPAQETMAHTAPTPKEAS